MHFPHTSCFYAHSPSSKLSVSSIIGAVYVDWRKYSACSQGKSHENGSLKGAIARLPHATRGDGTRQLKYTGVYTSHKDFHDVSQMNAQRTFYLGKVDY